MRILRSIAVVLALIVVAIPNGGAGVFAQGPKQEPTKPEPVDPNCGIDVIYLGGFVVILNACTGEILFVG